MALWYLPLQVAYVYNYCEYRTIHLTVAMNLIKIKVLQLCRRCFIGDPWKTKISHQIPIEDRHALL